MTDDTNVPAAEEKPQEVDRIRDIIFGSQMRAYDGNFQTIHRDLERLQQEIDRLNEALAEQEKNHNYWLQALEREMRKANDSLCAELRETAQKMTDEKADRKILGDLLIELGSQLKSAASGNGASQEIVETEPKGD